jgi:hypothetical protein
MAGSDGFESVVHTGVLVYCVGLLSIYDQRPLQELDAIAQLVLPHVGLFGPRISYKPVSV